MQHLFPIDRRQKLCRRLSSELFPAIGIDMGHHENDILLSQVVERSAGGKDSADKLMIPFDIGLLSRSIWVAIKDMNIIALDGRWIGELGAIICQDNREHGREA